MAAGSFLDWLLNQLVQVTTPFSGSERMAIVQDNATKYVDMDTLKNEMGAAGGTVTSVNGIDPDSAGDVEITKTDLGLGNVDNTSDANKPISTAQATAIASKIDTAEKGAALGVAPLGSDQLIPSAYLPPIAVTETFVVASQSAMLALTAQIGDVAVRTDLSKNFILASDPATTLANWVELLSPGAPVQSVNGQTGTVALTTTNIPEGTNEYFTAAKARSVVLTGISFVSSVAVTAADTFLAAFGKLQAQITALTSTQVSKQIIVPMARNNRLAVMGTSAVANVDAYGYMLPLIEPRLQRTRDCAGSGQNSTWMSNRFSTNVLNWEPGIILLDCGKNDLPTALPNTIKMIEEGRKAGAIVIAATTYGYPVTESQGANAYNAGLKAFCNPANGVDGPSATDPGIIFADTYSTMFNMDGTNKFPLKQSTFTGTNLTGATVIKVTDASQFTAGTGQFVFGGTIAKPVVIIDRDTVSSPNTITISRGLGGNVTAGTPIYSHPYFNDADHTSGTGSLVFANYIKNLINSAGILSNQAPRAPWKTVSAADMAAGAVENIYGRFATFEGSVNGSGVHEGILTILTGGTWSVTTDPDFRGKVQKIVVPAGTAAGQYPLITDSSFFPSIANLAGRKCAFHLKYRMEGWQNAGGLYAITANCGTFGHFPQFPKDLTSDYPHPFLHTQSIMDGLFEVWGIAYLPTDVAEAGVGFSISTSYAIPAGVTPPTISVGECALWDIDDPQLPRRWNPRSRIVDATSTLFVTDEVIWFTANGATNQTLPTPAGQVNPMVNAQHMHLINKGAGTVTLIGTVNGATGVTIASGANLDIYWDAVSSNWKS